MGAVTSSGGKSLKAKYREVLIGFERYSFTEEQIYEADRDFELAAADLEACQECDGELCKTIVNHRCSNPYWHQLRGNHCTDDCYPLQNRAYYALEHKGCTMYGRPTFAVHMCPGPLERKEELLGKKTRNWWGD